MCNIAGYAGKQNAAPILLEMLRKQQGFDGGASTGIVTIHEGKLYWRKVVGDVDTLIRTTDALYLPGTVGIAHSRPAGAPEIYGHAHPFVTKNEDMAAVTNGTGRFPEYSKTSQAATDFLEEKGYTFRGEAFIENSSFPRLKNGSFVSCVEVRMNLMDYLIRQGMEVPEALVTAVSKVYTDNVMVILNLKEPEKIFAVRTTRPMAVLLGDGETYMATTRFAFPEGHSGQVMQLPLHQACEITDRGVAVTDHKMRDCEPVCEMTPYTYAEGYRRISEMLQGKKEEPLYFDDLEIAVWKHMRDLWPEEHTLIQDARLVYDILYQLYQEGRLRTVTKTVQNASGVKDRIYMWLED